MKDLYAPNGKLIKGTAETVQGTARIGAWERKEDGTIEITEWAGETDIDWNTATTERDGNGEMLFVDEDGGLWPGSALLEEPTGSPEAYRVQTLYDDPSFLGVLFQHWHVVGDERQPNATALFAPKEVGRDLIESFFRKEDPAFSVTPVFTR